jgi:hypothetical protein
MAAADLLAFPTTRPADTECHSAPTALIPNDGLTEAGNINVEKVHRQPHTTTGRRDDGHFTC